MQNDFDLLNDDLLEQVDGGGIWTGIAVATGIIVVCALTGGAGGAAVWITAQSILPGVCSL